MAALVLLVGVVTLPLVGAALTGRELAAILEFPPPLEIPTDYPRWSWLACALVVSPFAALAVLWLRSRPRAPRVERSPTGMEGREGPAPRGSLVPTRPDDERRPSSATRRGFPPWGWLAFGWTIAWWVLAWTRFPWFSGLQHYTFFPLWLGFIVTVNALTFRASGTCHVVRAPLAWLALFAASALFWWIFEWLNRFVRNWHYVGVEHFGALAYALNATLCFSTVLPAVAATAEWLGTRGRWQARSAAGPAWDWLAHRATGVLLLGGGAAALVFTGALPHRFYPALWGAPLALLLGESICARRPGVWRDIAGGDWRRAATWAFAALICGFFWEMWNFYSLAKWIYTVPYVERAHVFEMPAPGYLGYLPFGLECLVVIERLFGDAGLQRPARGGRHGTSAAGERARDL